MNRAEKVATVDRIMMELCEHSVFTRDSRVAANVKDALSKLSNSGLEQLFSMVVLGRKEDEQPEGEEDEEGYVRFDSVVAFDQWCKDGDWSGAKDFEGATGVPFAVIQGKPFMVVHNRVFLKEDE